MRWVSGAMATMAGLWLAFAPAADAQDAMFCPGEDAVRVAFASGDVGAYPNYAEGGGARVQKQHPDTYIFGQAKTVAQNEGATVGICQYSNHVGVVAMFAMIVKGTVDPLEGCPEHACRAKPWWRTEYVESDPADWTLMQVCVVDRNGLAMPSVGCGFLK